MLPACGLLEAVHGHGDQPAQSAAPRAVPGQAQATGIPTAYAENLAPAVHIDGANLKDDQGNIVKLKGLNWFGYNTPNHAPLGLWNADPLAADFAHTVHRMRLLGFNAVRLPFSFAEFDKVPQTLKKACADVSLEDIAKATLDPDVQADLKLAGAAAAPPQRAPGECNGYLPDTTVRDRFIWSVQYLVAQGMYVLLDNHFREDQTATQDPTKWISSWASLVKQVAALPGTEGRVFLDLLNEPWEHRVGWENGPGIGLHKLYLAAMDAIWASSTKVIFALEGTGQDGINAGWGDGYCTDAGRIAQSQLSDPRPFFTELATKPYAKQVLLVPHVYGPSVTHNADAAVGDGLESRLTSSFGQQMLSGTGADAGALTFPVAIGEFGSKFEGIDKPWLDAFAAYTKGSPKHGPLDNWFYWCWNADSGDTGGLVVGDYKGVEWEKVRYLEGLGLQPWYRQTTAAPAPTPSPDKPQTDGPSAPASAGAPNPPAPQAPAAPAQDASAPKADEPATPAPAPQDAPQPAAEAGPSTPPAPAQRQLSTHPIVTTQLSTDGCECEVDMSGTWESEGKHFASLNLYLRNGGGSPIPVPYTFEVHSPNYAEVGMTWNLQEVDCKDGVVTSKIDQGWQAILPQGGNIVPVGFLVSGDKDDLQPHEIKINGRLCMVTHAQR